jgi:Fe2+ transport system protein FeoA
MLLSEMRPGQFARVIAIDGGNCMRQSLQLRGLSEGSVLKVVSNMGPITIEVNRSTVCIGRGMADRIRTMGL